MQFDFIVDGGDENLGADAFKATSQRLIDYFLAALTVPQKDLWVNLSPVEKDRIIPESLIKTELGRDLLSEDYLLKQLTASFIYPEEGLGEEFWSRVYDEAYHQFGVTEVPVDVFNKVWIVPDTASVYEKGNTVYVARAHLKVMLEADYLAQNGLSGKTEEDNSASVNELTKEILRQVMLPAIEKEVNEGKNFARLRQVVYSLILAQWYQDVLKESVLNRVYAGQSKMAGIDLSDPADKDRIYEQYLAAYRKGVFSLIKEETDRLTNETIPRKYFSGGFQTQTVRREPLGSRDLAMLSVGENKDSLVTVKLDVAGSNGHGEAAAAPLLSHQAWSDLSLPLSIANELKTTFQGGFDRDKTISFLNKYAPQIRAEGEAGYMVERLWTVLKAISLSTKEEEMALVQALEEKNAGKKRPDLEDAILLMNERIGDDYIPLNAPRVAGKKIGVVAMEIDYWVGGLGPVMEFDLKGYQRLGADASGMQPDYQLRRDRGNVPVPLDYEGPDIGLEGLQVFDNYTITVGDKDGRTDHQVKVRVRKGYKNGRPTLLFRDVQDTVAAYQFAEYGLDAKRIIPRLVESGHLMRATDALTKDHRVNPGFAGLGDSFKTWFKEQFPDQTEEAYVERFSQIEDVLRKVLDGDGPSFYSRMAYNYGDQEWNPVLKEESMAFFNIAMANFVHAHPEEFDILMLNDGQCAPFIAIMLSLYGEDDPVVKKLFFEFRTHTYDSKGQGSRGEHWEADWTNRVYKHMFKIKDKYLSASRTTEGDHVDDTSFGVRLAHLSTAVSNNQADDMRPKDPNSRLTAITNPAVPEIMAAKFREQFTRLNPDGDYERPTPQELAVTKESGRLRWNELGIKSAIGRDVQIAEGSPVFGSARRLVIIKMDWDENNILLAVQEGATILLIGNNQGTDDSRKLSERYRSLERKIATEKANRPNEIKGDFFFVDTSIGEQKFGFSELKKYFEMLQNVQVQPSYPHTGAAEFSEEDSTANGGYQAGPRYGGRGEGVITAQGIQAIVEERNGKIVWVQLGQTWVPEEDTPQSWWKTVYLPLIKLWKQDPTRMDFYRGAALSPRVNRIQHYLIPTATMLKAIDRRMEQLEQEDKIDEREVARLIVEMAVPSVEALQVIDDGVLNTIVRNLTAPERLGDLEGILVNGRNGVKDSFGFFVPGHGSIAADLSWATGDLEGWRQEQLRSGRPEFKGKGLRSFNAMKQALQEAHFGYDALLDDFMKGSCQNYLSELFSGTEIHKALLSWMLAMQQTSDSWDQKNERFGRFVETLTEQLERIYAMASRPGTITPEVIRPLVEDAVAPVEVTADRAQVSPGGIDVRNISVDRDGDLMTGVVSDQALEGMLENAEGLRGVILDIKPIANLANFVAASP